MGDAALPDDFGLREAVIARGIELFKEVAAGSTGTSALVTHGKLLALVLSALTGADPFELFVAIGNPHAFEVFTSGFGFELRTLWSPSV